MKHRVLVVDDEPGICQAVVSALTKYEFDVTCVDAAKAASKMLDEEDFDLVVLDIGLPGQSGTDFCRELRKESDIPVVFLTGHDADMDRIVGLEIGADDYMTKPFHPGVLLARARAVLRRSSRGPTGEPAPAPKSSVKLRLVVDDSRFDATLDGRHLDLTQMEFKILEVLMKRPGQVYTREQLKQQAYGPGIHVSDKTINTHIARIKSKVAEVDSSVDPIEASRGFGYRIAVENLGASVSGGS